jgi:hypothetical protein
VGNGRRGEGRRAKVVNCSRLYCFGEKIVLLTSPRRFEIPSRLLAAKQLSLSSLVSSSTSQATAPSPLHSLPGRAIPPSAADTTSSPREPDSSLGQKNRFNLKQASPVLLPTHGNTPADLYRASQMIKRKGQSSGPSPRGIAPSLPSIGVSTSMVSRCCA